MNGNDFFEVIYCTVPLCYGKNAPKAITATMSVKIGHIRETVAAEGPGPVHAIFNALMDALSRTYPKIRGANITDFSVKMGGASPASIEIYTEISTDFYKARKTTESEDIIEASLKNICHNLVALLKTYRY